jgi:hypothetical protein
MEFNMTERLYSIEIKKDKNGFLARLFSNIDGVKEFRNKYFYQLIRDITIDIELALDQFTDDY